MTIGDTPIRKAALFNTGGLSGLIQNVHADVAWRTGFVNVI